jgi:hypothetical protein
LSDDKPDESVLPDVSDEAAVVSLELFLLLPVPVVTLEGLVVAL